MKNENFSLLLTIFKPASLFLSLILCTLCPVFLPSSAIDVIFFFSFFDLKKLEKLNKKGKNIQIYIRIFFSQISLSNNNKFFLEKITI
jgi:hypothetical protein